MKVTGTGRVTPSGLYAMQASVTPRTVITALAAECKALKHGMRDTLRAADPPPKHLWERPPTFSARTPSGWEHMSEQVSRPGISARRVPLSAVGLAEAAVDYYRRELEAEQVLQA